MTPKLVYTLLVGVIGAILGFVVASLIMNVTGDSRATAIADRQRDLTFHRLPEGVCVVFARDVHGIAITAVDCPLEKP